MTLLISISIAILVAVGFDALLHGISHGGHGVLNKIWEGETNQRKTETWMINDIQWHILTDIIIGICIGYLISFIKSNSTSSNTNLIVIGLFLGILTSSYYFHVYAAYEVTKKSSFGLAALSFLQTNLIVNLISWLG